MNPDDIIYVAGHSGMAGSAIVRALKAQGFSNILTASSKELDLRNQQQVQHFFQKHRPDYVFMAAARVGGIHANNTFRADFLYENLMMECNVIHAAYQTGVKKLLFLGSSCIYPKMAPQPLKEEYLLSGPLEETNEPYAIAKIAGIKLCENYRRQYNCRFICVMPTNLYGPNDNYHPEHSHVLPALLRKFHEAVLHKKEEVIVWGSGTPRREFMHADDMADACVFLMKTYDEAVHINVGTGEDITIRELAELIARITGFKGTIRYDTSRPDGTPRKLLDVSRLHALGWKHKISLEEGIKQVYDSLLKKENIRVW
jgi:GDP-L-fucose synthase